MPRPSRSPESPARRDRRRRTHQRIDSYGEQAPRSSRRPPRAVDDGDMDNRDPYDSPATPSKKRPKDRYASRDRSSRPSDSGASKSASTGLSSAQLARLDRLNERRDWDDNDAPASMPRRQREREQRYVEVDPDQNEDVEAEEREFQRRERQRERRREEQREQRRRRREEKNRRAEKAAALAADPGDGYHSDRPRQRPERKRERRVVSGHALERGDDEYYSEKDALRRSRTRKKEEYHVEKDAMLSSARRRDGSGSDLEVDEYERKRKRKRNICIGLGIVILLLIIIIPVAVVISKKKQGASSDSGSGSQPNNSNLKGVSPSSIPKWAQGGYLDPFDWYTTQDFNVTFTDQKVGGLYIMGLNSSWDDNTRANPAVPKLNEQWEYGTTPMRGINLGGWLSIEPFITPSLFDGFSTSDNVVDEWTLTSALGPMTSKSTIEQHYATWVDESTFADIAAAGFDHVRIPYSYWAVTTYDGDPYVPMISWRYLLRGIEWARKYGLRVNLDLHALPGSQNGMNHSGHQGAIGWLNGTDGTLNAQRSLDLHTQLTKFFAQPRYKNIITLYGLCNEPRMTELSTSAVLDWSQQAIDIARNNGYNNYIVVGDGFFGLDKWHGQLQDPKVILDAHQYVIFNTGQIVFNHQKKVEYACGGWTSQAKESTNTNTGFGPTIFGEWSQADTDCATYLNNVGVGSRWEGTLNFLDAPGGQEAGAGIDSVLTPTCPTNNNPRCDCTNANVDPSSYSTEYKQWLLQFAEAQMDSFEYGWGWFYWTWKTESAAQWSWQAGLQGGYLPKNVRQRSWNCNMTVPDYAAAGLPEYY